MPSARQDRRIRPERQVSFSLTGGVLTAVVLCATLLMPQSARSQLIALDKDMSIDEPTSGWLPYIFNTDSLGTAIGVAGGVSGNLQRQAGLFGALYGTSNDSYSLVGGAYNFRLPGTRRLFADTFLLLGHFTDSRFYVDLDRDPTEIKAGSNDSDPDDFVTGISDDIQFEFTVKYPLPIGNAREDPISLYRLDRGLRLSGPEGGEHWNPMTSGKTTLATRAFYHYRDLEEETQEDELSAATNGLELWVDYDNTDFPRNPASGSRQKFTLTRDFGWFDSSNSWTNLEFEASKYFDLGTSNWFRQQVVALNFWTSNTPTWETAADNPQIVNHRPPPQHGSFLGGYDRMRAYPSARFHDKSAVYYAAELRLIPQTNPLRDIPVLDYFEIDWWQVVGFVEAGRVAPKYDGDLFTKDLKLDGGLGLRFMTFRNVVRLDWAVSEEGSSVWAMFQQPFAR